jgi:uncharacterized protein
MAEQIVSPGVFTRENDQSFITQQPVEVGAAIIGPTVKGPVEVPTVVTSYSEFKNKFGSTFVSGNQTYSFLTSISAYNYFQNGGNTLLVTRVASGSWTPATTGTTGANVISGSENDCVFVLKTISEGIIMNSDSTEDASGSLESGSVDNVRWEITSANTGSGTFTLTIRRGDDTTNEKVILETFANVSLDPEQDNYVAKVIGDTTYTLQSDDSVYYLQPSGSYPNVSKYVYVAEVTNATPGYFDNNGVAKNAYTASIPIVASGSFGSATGTILTGTGKYYENISNGDSQGLLPGNYSNAISLLNNKDEYQYNVITAPGLVHSFTDHASTLNTLIVNTQNRGDALVVLDVEDYGATISATVNSAQALNSSYAATYWPWVQITNPDTGKLNWVPASTLIPGVYAFNDNASEPWFAPAGINRGGLSTVVRPERKLTKANRDTLYEANVNPIASFPANGTVVFGQKTLQKKASALDRVNVRRLLIALKSYIGQIANNLVFEQNSAATRNSFLAQVNPYLESVQQRQGVYAFKVVMDDSNNTPDVIDRNQLVGQIFLQPTRTAEFIILDFNVLPTGAEFPA